jgi:hypothetical protein
VPFTLPINGFTTLRTVHPRHCIRSHTPFTVTRVRCFNDLHETVEDAAHRPHPRGDAARAGMRGWQVNYAQSVEKIFTG